MPTEPAIVVKNLSRHFGDFKAMDHISFEVHRGEVFGFLGPAALVWGAPDGKPGGVRKQSFTLEYM
jgi:ABC-type uncharacterized transport system ATPase subunit